MQTLFISQDSWNLITGGYEEQKNSEALAALMQARQWEYKENKKRDAKALRFIQQGVTKTIYPRIMGATKSKDAWKILKKEF